MAKDVSVLESHKIRSPCCEPENFYPFLHTNKTNYVTFKVREFHANINFHEKLLQLSETIFVDSSDKKRKLIL